MSWKDDKNLGPWEFSERPNKWGYLNDPRWVPQHTSPVNYNGIEDEEPQVWDLNATAIRSGTEHNPCGHWHKRGSIVPTQFSGVIETYIELLSSGCCMPDQCKNYTAETGPYYDATFISTYRPLDTNDYTGDTVTYTFEIIASNISWINDGYVYLVDEGDNIVATIIVPQGFRGPYTYNSDGTGGVSNRARQYWAFSTEFTPVSGAHQYGLRVYLASTGYQPDWYEAPSCVVKIPSARIIIRQENPTASVVHIPMFTLVNWCHMDWTGEVTDAFGSHAVSVGDEAGGPDIYTTSYPDCDSGYYGDECRQIWKFEDSQLANADKVVLDAGIAYYPSDYIPVSIITFFGVPTYTWANIDLRWSTYYTTSPYSGLTGSPGSATASDGSGHVFYEVEGSEIEWGLAADGVPWSVTVHLDLTSLAAADGHYLYMCSLENVYGGTGPSGPYAHWGKYRNFSIPVGRTLSDAWITYYAYYNTTLSRYELKCTFDYTLAPADIRNAYVILYDKTADVNIGASELVWDTFASWDRKSVEFDASLLTSGHEYMVRWKCEDLVGGEYPYVTDVNLWIKVTELSAFTSWLRVVKESMNEWRFPRIYYDYMNDNGSRYYLDISSRAKPYVPDGAQVYFEACVHDDYYNDEGDGPCPLAIWDTGEDVSGIGTVTSSEVAASRIDQWDGTEEVIRVTSGYLTGIVDNYYIINSYCHYYWGNTLISGFIVVEY